MARWILILILDLKPSLLLTMLLTGTCQSSRTNSLGENCKVLQEWFTNNPTPLHVTRFSMSDIVFLGYKQKQLGSSVVKLRPICFYKGFTPREFVRVGSTGNGVKSYCAGPQQTVTRKRMVFAVRIVQRSSGVNDNTLYADALDYGVMPPEQFVNNINQICMNQPKMSDHFILCTCLLKFLTSTSQRL